MNSGCVKYYLLKLYLACRTNYIQPFQCAIRNLLIRGKANEALPWREQGLEKQVLVCSAVCPLFIFIFHFQSDELTNYLNKARAHIPFLQRFAADWATIVIATQILHNKRAGKAKRGCQAEGS